MTHLRLPVNHLVLLLMLASAGQYRLKAQKKKIGIQ